jgi:hypothetical protein
LHGDVAGKYIGLDVKPYVNPHQLQGVPKDTAALGEYEMHIHCWNDYGSLIDNDGFQVPDGIVFSFTLDKGNKHE